MALGGGSFISQNKVLPGTYINFISAATVDASLADRGVAAMALELDWGKDNSIFVVTRDEFLKNSQALFGYDYGHDKMKGLRDLFLNIHTLLAYKLTSGGVKAENTYASAKHAGVRGNDLKISIQQDVDSVTHKVVTTYLGTRVVDEQIVEDAAGLVSNEYVDFKDVILEVTASTPLTGGTNGEVDGAAHQGFLDKAESHSFHALGSVSEEDAIKQLYTSYVKRMRDERGQKFQVVLHNQAADYEGVVNVKNDVTGDDELSSLVYWVTGVVAGTNVNQSALNRIYNGEFDIDVEYTQNELEQAIRAGEFTLHQVGSYVRVLSDINSLVNLTSEKGVAFQDNQTIRIIDQIANDIASLFSSKYLGSIPNDQSGRVSLQSDIVSHHLELQDLRAIEEFDEGDVTVEQGNTKKSIVVSDAITPINTMEKLYMSVVVQ